MISVDGRDSANCGQSVPCRTIGFALTHRAHGNDNIIRIQSNTFSRPFIISRSFPIQRNITLQGIGDRPTISAESSLQPLFMFEESDMQKDMFITIRIKNLFFSGIGILRLINVKSKISFENCHFDNVVADQDIIRTENHPHASHAGEVQFRNCNFTNNLVLRAIFSKQSHNVFRKCNFKNNLSTGTSLIHLIGFNIFQNSHFEKNTPRTGNVDNPIGGTVYAADNSILEISESIFRLNEAKRRGGAVYVQGKKLVINASVFEHNTAVGKFTYGGAVYARHLFTFEVMNSSFKGNKATKSGGAIHAYHGKNGYINSSVFEDNSVVGKYTDRAFGGAIGTVRNYIFEVLNSSFKGNKAKLSGGAINAYRGKKFLIGSSAFEDNAAIGKHTGRAFGGAIRAVQNYIFKVMNSSFRGNKAKFSGGATNAYNGKIILINSSAFENNTGRTSGGAICTGRSSIFEVLNSSFRENKAISRGGAILSSGNEQKGTICGCSFRSNKALSGGAVTHIGNFLLINTSDFQNNTALGIGGEGGALFLKAFTHSSYVDLSHCKFSGNDASFRGGTIMTVTHVREEKIRAAENFWGYIAKKEIRFSSCPIGYCCFENGCDNYSSCRKSRIGILCGQCEKGYTENLVTPECLLPEECKRPWYFVVVMLIGIVYVSLLMYLNEVSKALKSLLIPEFISNQLPHNNKASNRTSQIYKRMSQLLRFKSWSSVFPGLLNIIIFFYQTNVLFKTHTGSKSGGFVHVFQEALSTIFNLRAEGAFAQDLAWCPLNNLQPVSKALLKNSFIIYLFFLMLLVFTLSKTGKLFRITKCRGLKSSRLLCSILRLVLISYAGFTVTCFSLLSCVQLGHFGKRLFIDGSVQCYQSWQIVIIFVVSCWIAPFPLTIYASSQLLHVNMLSAQQFILCLLFPIPTIFYWLHLCCKNTKKELEFVEVLGEDAQNILQILEGPFRKRNVRDKDKYRAYRLPWESIYIGRRLVFIFIKTFVINTFLRLSLMLLCAVIFLVHHVQIKPFSSNMLNNIETVSLMMLSTIGFLNLIPAYNYTYPMYSYDHTQHAMQTLKVIETVLNLVFPIVIGLILAVFTCIRALQFMFWLCCCLVRFVRFCIKCQSP